MPGPAVLLAAARSDIDNDRPLAFPDACAMRGLEPWDGPRATPRPIQRSAEIDDLLWLVETTDGNIRSAHERARAWLLERESRIDWPQCVVAEPCWPHDQTGSTEREPSPFSIFLTRHVRYSTTLAPFELGNQPIAGVRLYPLYPFRPDVSRQSGLDLHGRDETERFRLLSPIYVAWGWALPAERRWVDTWFDGAGSGRAAAWLSATLVLSNNYLHLPGDWRTLVFERAETHTPIRLSPAPSRPDDTVPSGNLVPPETLGRIEVHLRQGITRLDATQHPKREPAIARLQREIAARRKDLFRLLQEPTRADTSIQVLGWRDDEAGRGRFQDLLLSEPTAVLAAVRYVYLSPQHPGKPGMHVIAAGTNSSAGGGLIDRSLLDTLDVDYAPDVRWYFEPAWRELIPRMSLAVPLGWSLQPSLTPWQTDPSAIREFLFEDADDPEEEPATKATAVVTNSRRLDNLLPPMLKTRSDIVLLLPETLPNDARLSRSDDARGERARVFVLPEADWLPLIDELDNGSVNPVWLYFARPIETELAAAVAKSGWQAGDALACSLSKAAADWEPDLDRQAKQLADTFDSIRLGYRAALRAMEQAVKEERARYDAVLGILQKMRAEADRAGAAWVGLLRWIITQQNALHDQAIRDEQSCFTDIRQGLNTWETWGNGLKRRLISRLDGLIEQAHGMLPALRTELAKQLHNAANHLDGGSTANRQ